jgi:tRNA (guanine9-N1)-methyltransferase
LEDYDPTKVYIIGGLIDRNQSKFATLNKAKELNIKALRFPISKYVKMKAASVLSINQSFDIMLRLFNGQSWPDIFKNVIP